MRRCSNLWRTLICSDIQECVDGRKQRTHTSVVITDHFLFGNHYENILRCVAHSGVDPSAECFVMKRGTIIPAHQLKDRL